MALVRSHRDLKVYQETLEAAMVVFELTKSFPAEEKYGASDQFRRASRSVPSNIGEGWRKRRYHAHFVSKLTDAEGEAGDSQVWEEISFRCGYFTEEQFFDVFGCYERIISSLVGMENHADEWCGPTRS